MSQTILIVAITVASLGFIIVIFKLLMKGGKLVAKLPKDYLTFFLIYGILGLTGFLLKDQIAQYPILMGSLLFLISLTAGIVMTNYLYEKWEWSMSASFTKKILYLLGITIFSIVIFSLIFLLCEYRGRLGRAHLSTDLVWWFGALIFGIILPLLIQHLLSFWNEIPKVSQLKHIFRMPIGDQPPFIEAGGETITFDLVIPYQYQSKESVKSKLAMPLHKSLEDALHYKIHEHNVVKRFPQKIFLAEENKRAKVYGWCFYRPKKVWWGLWEKKLYLDPRQEVVTNVSRGDTIYVERVKVWEQ